MRQTEYLTPDDTAVLCVDMWNRVSIYVNLAVSILFVISQGSCIAGGFWIIRKVGKHARLSSKTQQMHLQLTRLLIVQVSWGREAQKTLSQKGEPVMRSKQQARKG